MSEQISTTPLAWYRTKGTKWPLTCLAASIAGWDPQQSDEATITSEEYDLAVKRAEQLLEDCRTKAASLPDSTAARRVFVLTHPTQMMGVVAYKPSVAEATQLLIDEREDGAPHIRIAARAAALWNRVLWPAGPEVQRLMDDLPIAYGVAYPNAYMQSLGLSMEDVRKKL